MDLQIDLLKTFLAIIDTGGFTAASQVVHRSQSAISLQIKRLEDTIDQPLFKRSGRSFTLTAEGETLIPYARRMIKVHEEAVAALMAPDVVGAVRLGVIDEYASRFLPQILSTYASTYPGVQVSLRCAPSAQLVSALSKGELDIALVTGSSNEEGIVIRNESALWVTSEKHSVHEVDPVPLAVFTHDCVVRKWPMEALEKINKNYRIAYESSSEAGIHTIVSAGLAVAILYKSSVPDNFRILGINEGFPDLPVAKIMLKRSSAAQSKAVEYMAQHIQDGMR